VIDFLNKQLDQKVEFLVKIAAIKAIPSIKGEITKGKLKHRGIKLKIKNNPLAYTIFQRNIQLAPELCVSVNFEKQKVEFNYDPEQLFNSIHKFMGGEDGR